MRLVATNVGRSLIPLAWSLSIRGTPAEKHWRRLNVDGYILKFKEAPGLTGYQTVELVDYLHPVWCFFDLFAPCVMFFSSVNFV